MDFVLSKVVMSVCALTVAGILAAVAKDSGAPDTRSDLDELLSRFERFTSSLAGCGAASSASWTVPELPSGAEVEMKIWYDRVSASSGGLVRWGELRCHAHTWYWDGSELNASVIEALDRTSGSVRARSDQSLGVMGVQVMTDLGPELMLFVSSPIC